MKDPGTPHSIMLSGLLMLAGCGGGNDTSGPHPVPEASAEAPATAVQTSLNGDAPSGQTDMDTKVPARDASSISGELLATLLSHNTTGNGWVDEFYAYPAYPWNGAGPGGSINTAALRSTPLLHGGHDLSPAAGGGANYLLRFGTWYGRDTRPPSFNFSSTDAQIDLKLPIPGLYSPSSLGLQYKPSDAQAASSTRLTLGTRASVGIQKNRYAPDAAASPRLQLKAPRETVIRTGQRIPFQQPVHSWSDSNGNTLTLKVLAGATPSQVRLCLDQQLSTVKRLSCTIWQIPTGWTADAPLQYKGLYVADDRSLRTARRGQQYWQSSDQHPHFARPPVNAITVRGDFLATVLTRHVRTRDNMGEHYFEWDASPWDSASPRGKPLAGTDLPSLSGWPSGLLPEAGDASRQIFHEHTVFIDSSYGDALPGFLQVRALLPLQPRSGRLYPASWQVTDADPLPQYIHGKYMFTGGGQPRSGQQLLTLGRSARFTVQGFDGSNPRTLTLSTRRALTLRYGVSLPKGRTLQQWQDSSGNRVRLRLLGSYKNNQFRLCLDQLLPGVKRQSCTIWEAPDRWKLDQAPLFRGLYVADDRSAAGAQGMLYWQTEPARGALISL